MQSAIWAILIAPQQWATGKMVKQSVDNPGFRIRFVSHRSAWNQLPPSYRNRQRAAVYYSFIAIVHVYKYRHASSRLGRRRSRVGWNWAQFTLPWFLIGNPRVAQARSRFERPHGLVWTKRASHHIRTHGFVAARQEYPKCRGRHKLRRSGIVQQPASPTTSRRLSLSVLHPDFAVSS